MSANIGFISLGCPKNTVDSENIISRLRSEGYHITPSYEGADLVIVNTCGFIDEAVTESLDAIGEALNENGKVIVTGCLGAKEGAITEVHPGVLAVTGPQQFDEVMNTVHRHIPQPHDPFSSLLPPGGIKLTPRHYAYLKISEGCNHKCTFCIIPSMRGRLNSRNVSDIMSEATNLVRAGVRELLVVSQDTSAYGLDTKYKADFYGQRPMRHHITDLAKGLASLGAWVRLHYVYPYAHVDELVTLMADNNNSIVPYLDVPFQHSHPDILRAMKRPASGEDNLKRVKAWRALCPDLTIRSTFIVGFPGETEEHFQHLLDFLEDAQLDRVGCFTYSPVEGASANELADAVDEEVKQQRLERFMQTQQKISSARLRQKIGSTQRVIIDAIEEDGRILARSQADAPEIDGVVFLAPSEHKIRVGLIYEAHIDDADEYDLYGRLVAD